MNKEVIMKKWKIITVAILFFIAELISFIWLHKITYKEVVCHADKPVLYLYPEYDTTNMDISLCIKTGNDDITYDDINLFTYPQFTDGACWTCTPKKDGTVSTWYEWDDDVNWFNAQKDSRYLFWEADLSNIETNEWQYCIKDEETVSFLEDVLTKYGLNDVERTDFITYWAPILMKNPYNLISFNNNYTDLVYYLFNINDKTDDGVYRTYDEPQTFIRVFMTYQPYDEFIKCKEPVLKDIHIERNGFSAVEWGGACVPKG